MAGKENKVQFNLKNVYYAVMTTTGDTPAWSEPVKVPGAVTLSLDPKGDVTPFYADGITYYQSVGNSGYSGDLEMARYPDQMLKDVWKFAENETDKVLIENVNVEPAAFALLFQIDQFTSHDVLLKISVFPAPAGPRPARPYLHRDSPAGHCPGPPARRSA